MTETRTVVLDNEAVQALLDPDHRKHRRALSVVEAVAARAKVRSGAVRLVVPTAVRVEAGWNRRSPKAAAINRLRAHDANLDTESADSAAAIRSKLAVSVVDAHLASVLAATAGPHAVMTSDPDDMRRIVKHLRLTVNVVII